MKHALNKSQKISKEVKDIIRAITNFQKKHKGNVQFVGSFFAFDKDCNVIDDRLFAYGEKDTLNIDLKDLLKQINKEKGKFINF
jgi:hypothetical protein